MNSDNYTHLSGKGLFIFSDPAGAKAVLALVYDLVKSKKIINYKIISDRKYGFIDDFGLNVNEYQEKDENTIFDSFKPDFLFTGTSYTSKIELKFIAQSQKYSIQSYAFIDHWTNFYNRFIWDEKVIFPNKIWVIDEKAKSMAIAEQLPEEKIVVQENPYYGFLRNWQPNISRTDFLAQYHLDKQGRYVLYVPEPLSQVGGKEKFGFDEFEVLEQIIKELSEKYLLDLHRYLYIKPHPNQDLNVLEEKIAQIGINNQVKLLDKNIPINLLMYYADLVIGLFSNALIEGKLIGAKVVRLLPETLKIDFLDTEIKIIKEIYGI